MKEHLVITIGRENGSGGKYIGERLAEELGIKCYDTQLIEETAKKSNHDKKYVEEHDEKPPVSFLYFGGQPIPMSIVNSQANVIKEIASKESCVIIGRMSDYVLKDFDNVVNIFVHAPLAARLERYCRRKNVDIIKAEKMIMKEDKERAAFYNYYTNQIWGEAKNYHLSIDTSKVGIEGAVELIKEYIKLEDREENRII